MEQKKETPINSTLIFKRSELIYDIENYAYVVGDVTATENMHQKHHIFDVAQDGNEDLATRVMNLAHAECVEFLYPYTKTELVEDEHLTDMLTAPEEYVIELSLPQQFSRTSLLLLKKLIHDYIVCRVLCEWFGIVHPDAHAKWALRIEDIRKQMKLALMGRRKPLRRKQSMF